MQHNSEHEGDKAELGNDGAAVASSSTGPGPGSGDGASVPVLACSFQPAVTLKECIALMAEFLALRPEKPAPIALINNFPADLTPLLDVPTAWTERIVAISDDDRKVPFSAFDPELQNSFRARYLYQRNAPLIAVFLQQMEAFAGNIGAVSSDIEDNSQNLLEHLDFVVLLARHLETLQQHFAGHEQSLANPVSDYEEGMRAREWKLAQLFAKFAAILVLEPYHNLREKAATECKLAPKSIQRLEIVAKILDAVYLNCAVTFGDPTMIIRAQLSVLARMIEVSRILKDGRTKALSRDIRSLSRKLHGPKNAKLMEEMHQLRELLRYKNSSAALKLGRSIYKSLTQDVSMQPILVELHGLMAMARMYKHKATPQANDNLFEAIKHFDQGMHLLAGLARKVLAQEFKSCNNGFTDYLDFYPSQIGSMAPVIWKQYQIKNASYKKRRFKTISTRIRALDEIIRWVQAYVDCLQLSVLYWQLAVIAYNDPTYFNPESDFEQQRQATRMQTVQECRLLLENNLQLLSSWQEESYQLQQRLQQRKKQLPAAEAAADQIMSELLDEETQAEADLAASIKKAKKRRRRHNSKKKSKTNTAGPSSISTKPTSAAHSDKTAKVAIAPQLTESQRLFVDAQAAWQKNDIDLVWRCYSGLYNKANVDKDLYHQIHAVLGQINVKFWHARANQQQDPEAVIRFYHEVISLAEQTLDFLQSFAKAGSIQEQVAEFKYLLKWDITDASKEIELVIAREQAKLKRLEHEAQWRDAERLKAKAAMGPAWFNRDPSRGVSHHTEKRLATAAAVADSSKLVARIKGAHAKVAPKCQHLLRAVAQVGCQSATQEALDAVLTEGTAFTPGYSVAASSASSSAAPATNAKANSGKARRRRRKGK